MSTSMQTLKGTMTRTVMVLLLCYSISYYAKEEVANRHVFGGIALTRSSISVLALHDTIRSSALPKHVSQVLHDGIGSLIRSEMPAFVVLGFEHNGT
jgi:hypothetical protein